MSAQSVHHIKKSQRLFSPKVGNVHAGVQSRSMPNQANNTVSLSYLNKNFLGSQSPSSVARCGGEQVRARALGCRPWGRVSTLFTFI